jgi:hypothetical protein
MTDQEDNPSASHFAFPYFFFDTISEGLKLIGVEYIPPYDLPLNIYYGTLKEPDFINCWCSRWDAQDDSIIIETFLTESQVKTLSDNITPGAVSALFTVMGKTTYYDSSFGSNKLLFRANKNQTSNLVNMRNEFSGYVKNFTSYPIKNTEYLGCIFECLPAS